ncbi:MAG: hypothetical protein Q4G27_07825 [Flavobacteriaceae bacterium]|nr:hypothetical protein [Flavobacteriaceae bacterium]
MRKLIFSISALGLVTGLLAQKAEIEAVKTAFNSNNNALVLSKTQEAEAKIGQDRTIEINQITEMYYKAAQAAEKTGDLVLAAKYYAKLGQLEKSPTYKARNKDTKEWEYFVNEAEATKITSAGNYTSPREDKIPSDYMQTAGTEINQKASKAMKEADQAFNQKNYNKAGQEFLKAYHLSKALGNDNPLIHYYAALSMLQTEDKSEAAQIMQSLIDKGFTGVKTNYKAIDAKTGEEVYFASREDMNSQVKLNLVKNAKEEKTESIEEELYSNTTYAWYSLENYDQALKVGQAGLAKYPKNENMNQIISGVYFKTGNSEQFIKNLREKVSNGTATDVDYFNLAKSLDDNNASADEVKKYYQKAIELNKDFAEAYLNYALIIIKPEKDLVEEMNQNLGTSAKERKIYTDNQKKRAVLYAEALPYFEKAYKLTPDSIELIRILRNSYEVVGNDDKYFEFKELYESKVMKK